jgi:hypothetical protein
MSVQLFIFGKQHPENKWESTLGHPKGGSKL